MAARCAASGVRFVGLCDDLESPEAGRGLLWELKEKQKRMISCNKVISENMKGPLAKLIEATQPDVVVIDMHGFGLFKLLETMKVPYVVNFPGPGWRLGMTSWPLAPYVFCVLAPFLGGIPMREGLALCEGLRAIVKNQTTRVLLINSFFGWDDPKPYAPNCVFTGPTAPRDEAAGNITLPGLREWLDWVRAQKLKIVYVTMGSMIELKDWQVKAFYEGLGAIPGIAVAWSLKEKQQGFLPGGAESLPRSFFVNKWMPQAEMLKCPEVAAVITHCGWGGTMETLTAGKPIVACPFVGDQRGNAKSVQARGVGTVLAQKKLTAEMVRTETAKVLNEPSYAAAAREMRRLLLGTGGSERCAEVVEDVARHGGAALTTTAPSEARALARLAQRVALLGVFAVGLRVVASAAVKGARGFLKRRAT